MVERSAVNRLVVGSSPTSGAMIKAGALPPAFIMLVSWVRETRANSHDPPIRLRYNFFMDLKILKQAAINAILAFAYVTAVGLFMSNASKVFGEKDTLLTPVAAIMLLVFSAALMAILVFGLPVAWYLDGKKKPALTLLTYTMGSLLALLVLTFGALFVTR